MTDDIVARLRCYVYDTVYILCDEAADEIERLRAEIQQLKHDSTIFINERSDAICENFDLREENAELRGEIERLRAALDIIAGGNGLQMTWYSTAPMPLERYKENHYEMMQIARVALGKKETKQSTPGYEHMTPETVQAIRDTCSTPASRVGKTQSEVFKEEDTP